ncbi:MAG: hypothetical protein E7081_00970 [Bacteroidales bacterium]|nr:hypothetical protein [Bacteroidales bacterium]
MYQLLHCVALRTIKYNDKNSILSVYSLEMGRLSFLVSAGNGREANRRRAMLMPLSIFECVASIKPGRELHTMRDLRVLVPLHGLHSHPMKGAVTMFIADVLNAVLRESQREDATFAFLVDAITRFDVMNEGIANFHLCFLYKLGRFIGIEPDVSTYQSGAVFDMQEGLFRMTPPLHHKYLSVDEASVLAMLSRMTFDNMRFYRFNRNQRNDLLDKILEYYTIHYSSLSQMQSLDVLRSLFI